MEIITKKGKKPVEGVQVLLTKDSTAEDIGLEIQTDGRTLWVNAEDAKLGVRCILRINGFDKVNAIANSADGMVEITVI